MYIHAEGASERKLFPLLNALALFSIITINRHCVFYGERRELLGLISYAAYLKSCIIFLTKKISLALTQFNLRTFQLFRKHFKTLQMFLKTIETFSNANPQLKQLFAPLMSQYFCSAQPEA